MAYDEFSHRNHGATSSDKKSPVTRNRLWISCSIPPGKRARANGPRPRALDMGVAAPTITEAVFARCISAIKEERTAASKILKGTGERNTTRGSRKALLATNQRPDTAQRSAFPMRRISSSCAPRRRSSAGSSSSARSPASGAGELSFQRPYSCRRSRRPMRAIPTSRISCSIPISTPSVIKGASQLAQGHCAGRRVRRARPDLRLRPRLLRQLPLGPPARQPAAGWHDYFGAHTYERLDQLPAASSSIWIGPIST